MAASDAYDVVGVPAGTPVNLTAEFTVDGSVFTFGCPGSGCAGVLEMSLQSGALVDETRYQINLFLGSRPIHDVRRIPITIVAGSPVPITFEISGQRTPGGSHGSTGDGRLSFAGLPAGATVVSCQGHSSGAPTPLRRASWGSLKAIYR